MRAVNLLLFVIFMLGSGAHASQVDPTKIGAILMGPSYGTVVLFRLTNKPVQTGCHVNSTYSYAFDSKGESGKATLALVLALYAAQKDVWLIGKGDSCVVKWGVEDLGTIVAK